MGLVFADIELINGLDLGLAKKHLLSEHEVKRIKVRSLVDTGAPFLCINEVIQEFLQLPELGNRIFPTSNGEPATFKVVGPVELRFKDRNAYCNALVLPGDSEPLLGTMPLEELDVVIDVGQRQLVVNPEHPGGTVVNLFSHKVIWVD